MALHTVIKSDLDDDDDLRAAAMVRLTNSSWKARGHTLKPTLHSRGHIFVNLGTSWKAHSTLYTAGGHNFSPSQDLISTFGES